MLNHLGGIKKSCHHIKKFDDEEGGYEPAMIITRERIKGKSFIIPLESFWKYIEPKDNVDAAALDMQEFENIIEMIAHRRREIRFESLMAGSDPIKQTQIDVKRIEITQALAALPFAMALHQGTDILLCTGYNLAMCMQMLEITMSPQAAAQLLLFIQDGLDDLKNMPEVEEEKPLSCGTMELYEGSHKVGSSDMLVTETELMGTVDPEALKKAE